MAACKAFMMKNKYDGFQIESQFPRRYLCVTNGRYHWAGKYGKE